MLGNMPVLTQQIVSGENRATIIVDQRWVTVTTIHRAGSEVFSDVSLSQAIKALEPDVPNKMHWHIEQVGDFIFRHCVLPIQRAPKPLLYVAFCTSPHLVPTSHDRDLIDRLREMISTRERFADDVRTRTGIEALLLRSDGPPRMVKGTIGGGDSFRSLEAAKNGVAKQLLRLPGDYRWGLILEVWRDGGLTPRYLENAAGDDVSVWRWEVPD